MPDLLLKPAMIGLVMVTIFTLFARLWWAFDLFTHFRFQYVIAALILCITALALGTYQIAAVLGVVALVHGWAIKDLWLHHSEDVASMGIPLRVASVNVLDGNPTPQKVLDFVRTVEADLAILVDAQSDRWRPVLSSIGELYSHKLPEGWRDGAPIIVFSRHPVLGARVERLPEGGHSYLVTEIAVGDHVLKTLAVHPTSPSPSDARDSHWRNRQLAQIASELEGEYRPIIAAGDFNTSPWSPHFRDLLAATGLRNAADGHGWISTWPRCCWPVRTPIDHVLLRGPIAVAALRRGPAIGSDHYPIIADLELDPGSL